MISFHTVKRLKPFHARAIFYIMVSRNMPKGITEIKDAIAKSNSDNPERFEKVYNMVVKGIIDETGEKESQEYNMYRDMIDSAKQTAAITAVNAMDKIEDKAMEMIMKKVDSEIEKARPIVIKQAGKAAKKLKGVMPNEFETVLKLAASRVNTLLVGPSGCGKTFIAAKVAEALGLGYASVSCSAGMSESMLTGWLIPTGAAGKFEYVPSEFVKCYEKGGVFLLDEVDAADPNTMVFINQAIANDHFFIPQRHTKPLCKKHPNFHLIAAANTFGNGADMMFVGRNQLDAATMDRFRSGIVVMDYSDKVERALVDKEVYAWALPIRDKIRSHRLRRVMSTRLMLDLSKLKEQQGWGQEEWERTYFADWSKDEVSKIKEEF